MGSGRGRGEGKVLSACPSLSSPGTEVLLLPCTPSPYTAYRAACPGMVDSEMGSALLNLLTK